MDTDVHIPWIVVTVIFCVLGCKEDSDTPEEEDPCDDPTSLTIEAPAEMTSEPTQVASLVLDELALIDDAGARDVSGLLSAVFADVTNYEEQTTLVSPFGPACVARVGEPDESTGLEPMVVDTVVFRSDVFGERSLTPDEEGRLAPIVEETIFSSGGGETVEIQVSSTAGDMAFPSFNAGIVAPRDIGVPLVEENTDTSLRIEWTPSDASYMEIKLRAETPNPELPLNRLRCPRHHADSRPSNVRYSASSESRLGLDLFWP